MLVSHRFDSVERSSPSRKKITQRVIGRSISGMMEPTNSNLRFGLFERIAEWHPNIYQPAEKGTELHRAINNNNQALVDALLAAYQADFDKIRDYLVTNYQWDTADRIWLRNCNLIAIGEEQCKNCKLLEEGAPKSNDLKEAIFVVLKTSIGGEEIAVLHPNEKNRLEVLRLVRTLIPNGFLSCNYSESTGFDKTFLEVAASRGMIDIITRLIELGADLNVPDHNPLLKACSSHQNDTIHWLLTEHFDDFDCTQRNPYQLNAFLILRHENKKHMMDFVLMKMISYRQKYYNETETEAFTEIFHPINKGGVHFLNDPASERLMNKKLEEYIVNFKLDLSYCWENENTLIMLLRSKIAKDYCREEIRKNPKLLGITTKEGTTVVHECILLGNLDILNEIYERNPEVKRYFETDKAYFCLNLTLSSNHTESTIFMLENHAEFFMSNLEKLREVIGFSPFTHGDLLEKYFPVLATEIDDPDCDLQLEFQNMNLEFNETSIRVRDPSQSLSPVKRKNGMTRLHNAVDKDNTVLFVNLLEAGCDIDAIDHEGNHPIHYVKSVEMLNLIIEKHPEGRSLVHRINFEGYSVLHKVCSLYMDHKNLTALVEKVIEFGADVNQLTNNGESAIFFVRACTVLDILRKHNVNLEVVNNCGETALDRHLQSENECVSMELLSLLHERAFFKEHAHKYLAPFMDFIEEEKFLIAYLRFLDKHPDTAKLIFDSVYEKSREEASRLFCKACRCGNIFITERFLEFDYDLDYNYQEENNGNTPILILLDDTEPNRHLVRQLLKKAVDLEIRSHLGCTALMTLVKFNNFSRFGSKFGSKADLVQLLLDHGARIDSTDEDGNTALHCAFKDHEWELVELLVKNGADLSARNKDGKMPFQMAGRMYQQLFKFMH